MPRPPPSRWRPFAGGGFSTSKMRKRTNAAAIIARSTTTAGTPSTAGPAPVQLATAIHGRPRPLDRLPGDLVGDDRGGVLPRAASSAAWPKRRQATQPISSRSTMQTSIIHPGCPARTSRAATAGGGSDPRSPKRASGIRAPALTASIGNRPMRPATSEGVGRRRSDSVMPMPPDPIHRPAFEPG